MSVAFAITAVVIIASAVAAMSLRNLIHCSLCLVVTFAGLAVAFLQLNAQFVGFAQVLVYIGAVSILIVFAILLTRGETRTGEPIFSNSWIAGIGVAVAVLGVIVWTIAKSSLSGREIPEARAASVRALGDALMTRYILPLEVIGLLLTAALIGAVIIAMQEKEEKK